MLKRTTAVSFLAITGLFCFLHNAHADIEKMKVESIFEENCASCHGKELEGGMAGSLLDDTWAYGSSHQSIVRIIAEGAADAGMPAWSDSLNDLEINALALYIAEQKGRANKRARPTVDEDAVISAAGHQFKLRSLAKSDGVFWGLDYLPDGSKLITQRDGILWLFKDGELQEIKNTPEVWANGQGGLLDIAVHPSYKKNGWVYLAFSHSHDGDASMTKIVRGKLKKNTWVKEETIFQADRDHYVKTKYHFGSRIVFKDNYIFFGIGDRGVHTQVQDLSVPPGKIFRLYDDGRVPADNPYVNDKNALAGIWSFGHRNPQGMTLHPNGKDLWESEHGPRGGDEINVIEPSQNYGWPDVTFGIHYNGVPWSPYTEKPGMVQPLHYWVPSIGVSGIAFYTGDQFPKWQNQLLVTGMAHQDLRLLTIEGKTVKEDTLLFSDFGRVRDVNVSPTGDIDLLITRGGRGGDGHLVRLESIE